jgi:hypothetical protein
MAQRVYPSVVIFAALFAAGFEVTAQRQSGSAAGTLFRNKRFIAGRAGAACARQQRLCANFCGIERCAP